MIYPQTIPDFQAALLAYDPAADHADAIFAAQAQRSVVVQSISVFNTLKSAPELSPAGQALLVGAAFLLSTEGWNHGLGADPALTLIAYQPPASPDPED